MNKKPLRPDSAPVQPSSSGNTAPTEQDHSHPGTEFPIVNAEFSSAVSFLFHFFLLILLALLIIPGLDKSNTLLITRVPEEEKEELIERFEIEELPPMPVDLQPAEAAAPMTSLDTLEQIREITQISPETDIAVDDIFIDLVAFAEETAPVGDLNETSNKTTGTGLDGRDPKARGDFVGGTSPRKEPESFLEKESWDRLLQFLICRGEEVALG